MNYWIKNMLLSEWFDHYQLEITDSWQNRYGEDFQIISSIDSHVLYSCESRDLFHSVLYGHIVLEQAPTLKQCLLRIRDIGLNNPTLFNLSRYIGEDAWGSLLTCTID
jgi:hypothetical protein